MKLTINDIVKAHSIYNRLDTCCEKYFKQNSYDWEEYCRFSFDPQTNKFRIVYSYISLCSDNGLEYDDMYVDIDEILKYDN